MVAADVSTPLETGSPGGEGEAGRSPLNVSFDPDAFLGEETEPTLPPLLRNLLLVGILLAVVVYGLLRPRELGADILVGIIVILIVILIFTLLGFAEPEWIELRGLWGDRPPGNGTGGSGGGGGSVDETSGEIPAVTVPLSVSLLAIVTVGVAIAAVALAAGRFTVDLPGASGADEEPREDPAVDVEAVRAAAGTAADRIEATVDVDNEVYDAWRRMTEILDAGDPASATPGEFASAAVDAGLDEVAVDRLTTVFEEVRYGGADPAGDRERAAVEALRTLERGGEDP